MYSIKLTGSPWDWVGYVLKNLITIPSSFQVSADINTAIGTRLNLEIVYSDKSLDSYYVDITESITPIITAIPDPTKTITTIQIRLTLLQEGTAYMDNINLK